MPRSRARPDLLGFAAATLALGALALTAAAASRPGDPGPRVPAAVPAASAAQPVVLDGVAPVSRELTDPLPAEVVDHTPVAGAAPSWVAGVSAATAIPSTALRAYADASLVLAAEAPSCRLGWTTLAAVGAIESGHGSHGDSVLQADGRAEPPIIGPALDGQAFAAVPATDASTALHGDPVWDHALGPMQFIPSTWERWGADGDGDGRADPQDIDDAALAAGRYLCAGGRDLAGAAGWQAAVLSYNHSLEYVAQVFAVADTYGRAGVAPGAATPTGTGTAP